MLALCRVQCSEELARYVSCCLQPIVDGAFSPDGQHLATASLDGFVKFYEIVQDQEPR